MVEELKLAIKIDDASIEQSLLKQFTNAQKMADKVVLNFKNVNFDNKHIEDKFKEMQKRAGQNPIDLTIGGNTLDMLGQIDKRLTEIFSIGKGKSFIDSSSTVSDIGKIENKINELNKKYEEAQKKLSSMGSGGISGKDVNLVDNDEFKKLSQEVSELKGQFDDLKTHMSLLDDYTVPTDRFFELQTQVEATSVNVSNLVNEMTRLSNVQKNIGAETNISNGTKDAFPKTDTKLDDSVSTAKELDKTLEQVDIPTDSFDEVLKKLNLTKSELVDIVKITEKSSADKDGKLHTSYTLKDSRGSTEIYGINSKTDKGQLLDHNIVRYDKKKDELDVSKAQLEIDKQLTKEEDNLAKNQQKKVQAFLKEQANYEAEQKKAEFIKKQTAAYEELNNTINKYSEVAKRVASGKAEDGDLELMTKLEDKISQLQKQPILSDSQVTKSEKRLVSLYDQLDKIEKKLVETNQKSQDKQISGFDKRLSGYDTKLANYQATANKFTDGGWTSDKYTQNITQLNASIEKYRDLLAEVQNKGIASDEDIKNLNKYESEIKEVISTVSNMSAAEKGFTFLSGQKELDKINSILNENSAMSKQAKAQIRAYYAEIKSGNPRASLDVIHGKIMEIVNAEAEAGRAGKSMFAAIKEKAWYGVASAIGTYFGFNDILRYGGEAIQTVREFNTALTEMRKVSDETVQSLKNYQAITFDTADAVGTTALHIQNSTADYMRLGESIDEAAESAKTANILLNVSEFDNIEDATKSLVSMGQAYKDLDKMTIVDKLNEVGNNYAISTDELATSLQKSAATLSLMGNSIDEAASLVTTANATIQDADSVSAGLRTISLRLVGTEEAEEELSAMNEEVDAFVKATNSKKQQIIKDYTAVASNNYQGFDILDSNGNYKNTYQILLGIAKVYKEIQEQDKKLGTNHATALIEELAGKNRSNIASAILQDPTQLEAVKKSSEEALGSAENELNSYLDSIDGKMAQLQNRAQEFWFKVIDSETIKNGIDLLTTLAKGATDFVDTVGLLPTLLTGISAALSFKNVGRVKIVSLM